MNRTKPAAAALLALMLISGCNTVAGIGKDLQAGGDAISQASVEVRDAVTGNETPARTASTQPPR